MTNTTGAPEQRDAPRQAEVAAFYDSISVILAELIGGSLHAGYWESPDDSSTMAEAAQRLTRMMAEKIEVGPGSRVLDIGCGNGIPAIQLAQATGASVVGITISPVQASLANQNAAAAGMSELVTFQHADAMDLPFPADTFDAVWFLESIFHMPDRLTALQQAAKVLKPGGRLALTDILADTSSEQITLPGALSDSPEAASDTTPPSGLEAPPVRLEDYDGLLEQAGLTGIEAIDITENSVARTFGNMGQTLIDDRDRLVRQFGNQLVEMYEQAVPLLTAAGWGYGIVVATAPIVTTATIH